MSSNDPPHLLLPCSSVMSTFFPNIHTLLRLLATLPVTTAHCERSISGLKLLKTCLRSTMTNQRLNGLALMKMHKEVEVDPEAVIDAFAKRFKSRMATQLPRDLLLQDSC